MAAARHNYSTHSLGMTHSRSSDYMVEEAAKHASTNLLVAMLRSGQHSLDADRFWGTVRELREMGVKL